MLFCTLIAIFVVSFLCRVCVSVASSPTGSFVFISPPASFVHHNIALGLCLQSRGHAVTFLTLTGFKKHFDRQASLSSSSSSAREEELIIPVTIHEVAPYIKDRRGTLGHSSQQPHSTNPFDRVMKLSGAIDLYENHFKDIKNNLGQLLGTRNISEVFGSDSVFIIPGPWPTPLQFVRDNNLPHVVLTTHTQYSNFFFDRLVLDQSSLEATDKSFGMSPRSLIQRLKLIGFAWQMWWNIGHTPVDRLEFESVRERGTLRLVDGIPQMTTKKAFGPLTVFVGPVVSDQYMSREHLTHVEKEFLDGQDAVVYLSLGSNAVLSARQVQLLFAAVVGHAWKLMWAIPDEQIKLVSDDQTELLTRFKHRTLILPWSHTASVLAHNRVKLFVSHCGANGLGEALATGTPIVGLPLFGDQPQNCFAGRNLGVARCFDIHSVSVKELHASVAEIMRDEDRHPLTVAAAKMKTFTTTAYRGANTAADWLEAAHANGGDFRFMQTAVEIEGFVKGYCLDLICGSLFIVTTITYWIFWKVSCWISTATTSKSDTHVNKQRKSF